MIIIYFSGTGNSKYIAKQFSKKKWIVIAIVLKKKLILNQF